MDLSRLDDWSVVNSFQLFFLFSNGSVINLHVWESPSPPFFLRLIDFWRVNNPVILRINQFGWNRLTDEKKKPQLFFFFFLFFLHVFPCCRKTPKNTHCVRTLYRDFRFFPSPVLSLPRWLITASMAVCTTGHFISNKRTQRVRLSLIALIVYTPLPPQRKSLPARIDWGSYLHFHWTRNSLLYTFCCELDRWPTSRLSNRPLHCSSSSSNNRLGYDALPCAGWSDSACRPVPRTLTRPTSLHQVTTTRTL